MCTLEVDAGFAILRILTRAMLHMVLRAVINLLFVKAYSPVAVHTSELVRGDATKFCSRYNYPTLDFLTIFHV